MIEDSHAGKEAHRFLSDSCVHVCVRARAFVCAFAFLSACPSMHSRQSMEYRPRSFSSTFANYPDGCASVASELHVLSYVTNRVLRLAFIFVCARCPRPSRTCHILDFVRYKVSALLFTSLYTF